MSKKIKPESEILKSRLKSVDDELIGRFNFTTDWKFQLRTDFNTHFIPANDCKGQHNIVIILESPHKHEFEGVDLILKNTETKINSRPLNNEQSRRNLINLLNGVFKNRLKNVLDTKLCYNVVLINSIQYQCSLGVETSLYRNKLFLWNWIDLKSDFVKRVRDLNPVYIINCCTKGYSESTESYLNKKNVVDFGLTINEGNTNNDDAVQVRARFGKDEFTLQDIVERQLEINELISDSNYFKYKHPSSPFENGYEALTDFNKMNFTKKIFRITPTPLIIN